MLSIWGLTYPLSSKSRICTLSIGLVFDAFVNTIFLSLCVTFKLLGSFHETISVSLYPCIAYSTIPIVFHFTLLFKFDINNIITSSQ